MRYFQRSAAIGLIALASSAAAFAEPAKIIILRHGEKDDAYALCKIGIERAHALEAQFLGRGAKSSLFGPGEAPTAILAITLHTIETITPVAQSWNVPITAFTVVPGDKSDKAEKDDDLDERTKEAAHEVLTNPAYAGKVVIMTWEHKRIASDNRVTLRQLLHLDQAKTPPPAKWEGENYNFFWIVTYGPGTRVTVDTSRQTFTGKFADLPDNDWGKREHDTGDCK